MEARAQAELDGDRGVVSRETLPLHPAKRAVVLEQCRAFLDHHCMFRSPPGPALLTSLSGGRARWQLYMPVAILDQQFMRAIALLFWDKYLPVFRRRPFQLCGVESGGVPLVCALQAAAYAQWRRGQRLRGEEGAENLRPAQLAGRHRAQGRAGDAGR